MKKPIANFEPFKGKRIPKGEAGGLVQIAGQCV